MILVEKLHGSMRAALESGPCAVIQVARDLKTLDLGLLLLWLRHAEGKDAESGRVLAIECGRTADNSISRACRAWLTAKSIADLGIVHTLLAQLHQDVVERGSWPSYLVGQVLTFLREALAHEEPSVRGEVLSLATVAVRRGLLGRVLHAEAALPLVAQLRKTTYAIADAEEMEDLALVEEYLGGGTVPDVLRVDSRPVQRIVLDLMDAADQYAELLQGLDPLIEFVRRRALLDDAGARVARHVRPLQTIRVRAPQAATRVIESIVGFAEAVVGVSRHLDFGPLSAPDYQLQIAWAPSASVPIHLSFADDDARTVFVMLESLLAGAKSRASFEQVFASLPPTAAAAFLRLLERIRQHDESVEVVLTDPRSPVLQRSVFIGPETLGRESVASLMKHARSLSRGRAAIVSADEVPQANTVHQVFQAVDAMVEHGDVTLQDITEVSSQRQINYYKQGARILGFFDEDNQPTSRAHSILGLSNEKRLAITSVYFEDSPIGRAWRSWSGVSRLQELDPQTAKEFLEASVVGLSGSTPGRRASTLRAWLLELAPHYPAGDQ